MRAHYDMPPDNNDRVKWKFYFPSLRESKKGENIRLIFWHFVPKPVSCFVPKWFFSMKMLACGHITNIHLTRLKRYLAVQTPMCRKGSKPQRQHCEVIFSQTYVRIGILDVFFSLLTSDDFPPSNMWQTFKRLLACNVIAVTICSLTEKKT